MGFQVNQENINSTLTILKKVLVVNQQNHIKIYNFFLIFLLDQMC